MYGSSLLKLTKFVTTLVNTNPIQKYVKFVPDHKFYRVDHN
jgi:hypothetical protein